MPEIACLWLISLTHVLEIPEPKRRSVRIANDLQDSIPHDPGKGAALKMVGGKRKSAMPIKNALAERRLEPGRSATMQEIRNAADQEKMPLRPLGKKTPVALAPAVVAPPPVTMFRT